MTNTICAVPISKLRAADGALDGDQIVRSLNHEGLADWVRGRLRGADPHIASRRDVESADALFLELADTSPQFARAIGAVVSDLVAEYWSSDVLSEVQDFNGLVRGLASLKVAETAVRRVEVELRDVSGDDELSRRTKEGWVQTAATRWTPVLADFWERAARHPLAGAVARRSLRPDDVPATLRRIIWDALNADKSPSAARGAEKQSMRVKWLRGGGLFGVKPASNYVTLKSRGASAEETGEFGLSVEMGRC